MDTSDPGIKFNQDGICDHCITFKSKILPFWDTGDGGHRKLKNIVAKIKEDGKSRDFDCIMGMSGGIDSSYLLYVMKTKYELNPLVFHVDAGWNSQTAVNNIEKLVDGLNLDLFTSYQLGRNQRSTVSIL